MEQLTKKYNMFNLTCIIFVLIIIYSLIFQIKIILNYKKNIKIIIKDSSGLFVSKEILKKNNLGTLYVTKMDKKYMDHYDIERNVIRLSNDVYYNENLSSMVISFYQVIKALVFKDNRKRKENKLKFLFIDIINKISFAVFIISAMSKDLGVMLFCLFLMIIVIIVKYLYIEKYNHFIQKNLLYLKKTYKLKKEDMIIVEKYLNILVLNELSLHLFNYKY